MGKKLNPNIEKIKPIVGMILISDFFLAVKILDALRVRYMPYIDQSENPINAIPLRTFIFAISLLL